MNNFIYENENFSLSLEEDFPRIFLKKLNVMVLPYTKEENSENIKNFLFIKERNITRNDKFSINLITGIIEYEENVIQTICRKLYEEGRIILPEDITKIKINYLGFHYTNKWSNEKYPIFCVDITGFKQISSEVDEQKESEKEVIFLEPSKVPLNESLVNSAIYLFIKKSFMKFN